MSDKLEDFCNLIQHWIDRIILRFKNPERTKLMRSLRNKYQEDMLVRACNMQPAKITFITDEVADLDLELELLINGEPYSCSAVYCRPVPLTKEETNQLIEAYNDGGERGLAMFLGYSPEWWDNFEKNWR